MTTTIAVTGATGYIGARLVPRVLAAGHRVRCLVRSPRKLQERAFAGHPGLEIVACDLQDESAAADALRGCELAYYLVHSMLAAGKTYAATDRGLARAFASAAATARLGRIVYLGGLGETGGGLSEHLTSRREVEHELAVGPVPVTTLRAAMIVGAGSASFEILRHLVERLPVMVTPRWVSTRCQPIAVADVLDYLVACGERPDTAGLTLDIGGPDIVTYRDVIRMTARACGLPRRWIVPVPVLTPRLSSLWIHLVTPISARIARPLAEGLRNEVVCRDDRARALLPLPRPLLGVEEAIAAAVHDQRSGAVASRWSDAGAMPGDPKWAGGTVFVDPRSIEIDAPPEAVYRAVCRVGGGHGWYAADWLWRLRGWLDRLVGGPGLRRGRRDPDQVGYGDALDFWRVTDAVPGRRLELHAEMKLPGTATLTFEIEALDGGARSRLRQTARFRPRGLLGVAYWYAVLPLHGVVFRGMQRGIRRAAEAAVGAPATAVHEGQRSGRSA
ncbi:MAG: SDR family oxidoreductase [Planctomycetota bacterium]